VAVIAGGSVRNYSSVDAGASGQKVVRWADGKNTWKEEKSASWSLSGNWEKKRRIRCSRVCEEPVPIRVNKKVYAVIKESRLRTVLPAPKGKKKVSRAWWWKAKEE